MTNILLLHESEQPTSMGIFIGQQKAEKKYGQTHITKQFPTCVTPAEIAAADVILCVRGESPMTEAILRYAKEQKKFLIFYLDDDLKDIPKTAFRFPGRKKWLLRCMSHCDMLQTPNQLIAEEYAPFLQTGRTVVSHTSIEEEELCQTPPEEGVVKLVYAASQGHVPNFNAFIAPILPRLFERYGRKIQLHLIGLHPEVDVGEYNDQIHYVPGMSLEAYNAFMREHHYDIGLSPLVTNHFTERKYFNKYIEYAKVGICGVYSRVMPYQLAVRDGWNGYYADNDPESWFETLCRAIEGEEERHRIVETAQEHLRTCHAEAVLHQKAIEDIPELVADYTQADRSYPARWPGYVLVAKVRHGCFRIWESIYLSLRSLKQYGLQSTWNRIKRKIRR